MKDKERCARGDMWRLAKNILKLKEKDKAAFYSPTNEWSLPAPSTKKTEVVVDSGASMHMVSRKDLNSADLETVKVSESPTTVVTANGEVQTKEEATVCQGIGFVRDSDCFSKVHRQLFHSENSSKITGKLTIGPVVRNHVSSKMAER